MLFIMSSEADEEKGHALVCEVEALAPISFEGQLPPSHMLLSLEAEAVSKTWDLGEGLVYSVDLVFSYPLLAHYFYLPSS